MAAGVEAGGLRVEEEEGVIIEGEPGKNLGGPVRRGDTVVKIAALSSLYVEAAVSERDLSLLATGQRARLTLLAQPAQTYALQVTRIIPQASVVDGDNAFPVRLEVEGETGAWWRPGMTGLARIDAGDQNILWLITRRAIDALRMKLWW